MVISMPKIGFNTVNSLGIEITLFDDIRTLILPIVRSVPFRICCYPLLHSIESEIMDGFWHLRCLNNHMDLPYMIGTLASSANASSVAKNGTKQIIPLPSIK